MSGFSEWLIRGDKGRNTPCIVRVGPYGTKEGQKCPRFARIERIQPNERYKSRRNGRIQLYLLQQDIDYLCSM